MCSPTCMDAQHVSVIHEGEKYQILWNWRYGWLKTTIWGLGIGPESFARATSVRNPIWNQFSVLCLDLRLGKSLPVNEKNLTGCG